MAGPSAPAAAGTVVAGKYRLTRPIGMGAMGHVWAAVNEGTGREVAVKLIAGPEPELKIRLLREARACGQLKHRNIIEVLDVVETADGDPVLVMPLLTGETLAERLTRKRRLDAPEATRIARDVARALSVAHAQMIIHRDLKPANIFLHLEEEGGDFVVKVLDFGVAKNFGHSDGHRTVVGGQVGSPFYMSPEQAMSREADPRADIWSLGVVMFEMLTGVRPFQGEAGEVIQKILTAEVPLLSRLVMRIDPQLVSVVARCMSRDVERRIASAAELLSLLPAGPGDSGGAVQPVAAPPASMPSFAQHAPPQHAVPAPVDEGDDVTQQLKPGHLANAWRPVVSGPVRAVVGDVPGRLPTGSYAQVDLMQGTTEVAPARASMGAPERLPFSGGAPSPAQRAFSGKETLRMVDPLGQGSGAASIVASTQKLSPSMLSGLAASAHAAPPSGYGTPAAGNVQAASPAMQTGGRPAAPMESGRYQAPPMSSMESGRYQAPPMSSMESGRYQAPPRPLMETGRSPAVSWPLASESSGAALSRGAPPAGAEQGQSRGRWALVGAIVFAASCIMFGLYAGLAGRGIFVGKEAAPAVADAEQQGETAAATSTVEEPKTEPVVIADAGVAEAVGADAGLDAGGDAGGDAGTDAGRLSMPVDAGGALAPGDGGPRHNPKPPPKDEDVSRCPAKPKSEDECKAKCILAKKIQCLDHFKPKIPSKI